MKANRHVKWDTVISVDYISRPPPDYALWLMAAVITRTFYRPSGFSFLVPC